MTMIMKILYHKKGKTMKQSVIIFLKISFRQGLAFAGLGVGLLLMAFSAAFTGAILAPIMSMGFSSIMGLVDVRFPQFPKDVFDGEKEDNYEDEYEYDYEDAIIDVKSKKSYNESHEPYKRVKVSFDRLNEYNRRNHKFKEFVTTENSLNYMF